MIASNRPFAFALLTAALVLGAATGALAQDGEKAASEEPVDSVFEETTVTAQKRTEALIEVPVSVDTLTEAELEERRVRGIEELVPMSPNLDYAEFGDGQYRLMYRGIGASGTSQNQTFSTAINTVIVPYNRAFRLLDLDTLEVATRSRA